MRDGNVLIATFGVATPFIVIASNQGIDACY